MKTRTLVAGSAAALILIGAGTAFYAHAQGGPGFGPGGHGGPGFGGRPGFERLTREDASALIDARIAAITGTMKFTAAQQPLWAPVEKALREALQDRADRVAAFARGEGPGALPYPERLDRMATFTDERAKDIRAVADAVKPLWATLDERQQRLLPVLMREAVMGTLRAYGRGAMAGHWGGHHGGGPRQ